MTIHIRPESPADQDAIGEITRLAFMNHPHSRQTEQFIIQALRDAKALSVSLVAEEAGRIVGHVGFSPVSISDGTTDWYGLGPISVHPERQGQGIGRALMENGLDQIRTLGAHGCALVGDPSFYRRFGFSNSPALVYEGILQEYFLVLSFGAHSPQGVASFHAAFAATA
jgi:putative acetyltransferase